MRMARLHKRREDLQVGPTVVCVQKNLHVVLCTLENTVHAANFISPNCYSEN
jgi:hypothetical protein